MCFLFTSALFLLFCNLVIVMNTGVTLGIPSNVKGREREQQ